MNSLEIENGTMHLYRNDKKLAAVIDAAGRCTLSPGRNYYFALLRAIIGQQLSIKAAASINKRFMEFFDSNPLPENILNVSDNELRSIGLSNAKVKYVKDLSSKILNKDIKLKGINKRTNEEIETDLTKVKGIGKWTVDMFLIFTLNRFDVLPVSDLGIKRATMKLYGLRKLPDEKKIRLISKKNNWSPYNSIASWYLWRSLDMRIETSI